MGWRVGAAGVIMHHSLVNRWPLAETVGASRPYIALPSLVNPLLSLVRSIVSACHLAFCARGYCSTASTALVLTQARRHWIRILQVLQTHVLQHYPDEYVGDEAVSASGVRVHGFHLDKVQSPHPTVLKPACLSLVVTPQPCLC